MDRYIFAQPDRERRHNNNIIMNLQKNRQEQFRKYQSKFIEQKKTIVGSNLISMINSNLEPGTMNKVKHLMNSAMVRKSSSSGNIFTHQQKLHSQKHKKQSQNGKNYTSPFDRIHLLTSSRKEQRGPTRKGQQSSKYTSTKPPSESIENRKKIYNMPFYLGDDQQSFDERDPKVRQIQLMYAQQKRIQSALFNYSETISTTSSSHAYQLKITDFQLGRQLGAGKFGKVSLARHKESGFMCAIKRIPKIDLDEVLIRQLIRQVKIQMYLNHPNIVKLYTFFADRNCIYLVLQLCISGQLYHFLRKKKVISQQLGKVIIRQICQGLDYIHQNNIIHRDLKPQNILYHHGMMKICDFGWSVDTHLMRNTFCGTPLYISPELLKRNYYDKKIDSWSLGVLSYQILLGKVPFEIFSEADYIKIIKNEVKLPMLGQISQDAKDFLHYCMQKDPQKRLDTSQMLEHPFLAKVEVINFPEIF